MENKKKGNVLILLAFLIFLLILFSIHFAGTGKDNSKKIGFILSGSRDEYGWNGMHYNGFKSSCEKLGVQMLIKENVKEFTGECEKAIRELVEEGATMIVLSSYGYSQEVYDLVQEYPEIVFYGNSSEYHSKNLTSYFARMYQARYLAGIVAGMKSQTNEIGYVAAMENNEVNRGINAFTLGVKRVNPDAKVHVIWTNTWDDEETETLAAKTLIEERSVDVLTYHQNQDYVAKEAERHGVYSIGYHVPLEEMSSKYLTSVVCNWSILYEEIIKQFLQGKANSIDNFWIGIDKDVVGLSEFSDEVTPQIVDEIEKAINEMHMGHDVFSGEIYDNKGQIHCEENEIIRDEVLLEQFNWFVEGVEIYEE
jgi:basic membrane protein A